MRRLARLLPLIVIISLIAVAAFVLLGGGPLAEHVRKVVETELGKQLDRPVSIGRASLTLTGGVVLHDVAIRNKDGSALLKTPVMSARVGGIAGLLRGKGQKLEVRSVRLERPELNLVRRADGTWSVGDLVQRVGKGPSAFRGTVTATDARLTLLDETRSGQTTSIEGANVTVRQPAQGRTEFRLRAGTNEGVFESLDLRGQSDAAKKLTELSGRATGLSVPYALERIPGLTALTAAAGRANVSGEISLEGERAERKADYFAKAELSDVEVSFPWLRRPVTQVAGELELENGELRFGSMTGTVEGAPVELKGAISGLPRAQFALELVVTGIRYPQLRALFPRVAFPLGLLLPSPLRVSAKIEGPADDIVVSGDAQVKVIKFHAIPWHDLVGEFEYQDGRLKISKLRAHGSPRRFEADIEIDLRDGVRAQGSLALANMPLAMLAQMAGIKGDFAGTVRANLRGATTSGELSGDFVVERARIQGVDLGRVVGEFAFGYRDGSIALRRVRLSGPAAEGTLSADISLSGAYRVEARLAALDLSQVGVMLRLQGVRGQCCAEIKASGRVREGRASAHIVLTRGELHGQAFDTITADVRMTREQVGVMRLQAQARGARAEGDLSVSGWRGRPELARLSGELAVTGVALAEWLPRRDGGPPVEGTVSGKAEIGGTLAEPVLIAALRGEGVAISGQALARAEGRIRYSSGRVTVEHVDLRSADGKVVVAGGYTPAAGMDIVVTGKEVDLAALGAFGLGPSDRYGLAVTGRLELQATVTGTPEEPVVEVPVLRVAPLTINGEVFPVLSAAARVEGWPAKAVRLKQVELHGGDYSIMLSGDVYPTRRELDIAGVLDRMDIGAMLRVADTTIWRLYEADRGNPWFQSDTIATYLRIPRPLSGRLSGSVRCRGPYAEPRFETELDLRDFGFDSRTIQQIAGALDVAFAQAEDRRLALRLARVDLRASQDVTSVLVSGGVGADGQVSVGVDAANFDLRVLNPWLAVPIELGGEAKIDFNITGPIERPEILGGIFADDLKLGPIELEAASAFPIRLRGSTLALEDVMLRKGEMEAHGQASLPVTVYGLLAGATAELHVNDAEFAPVTGMTPAVFSADVYLQGGVAYLRDGSGPAGPGPGIRGKLGSGQFTAGGEVHLAEWLLGQRNGAFSVTAAFHRAEVAIPGLFDVEVNGQLDLTNDAQGRPLLTTERGEPRAHAPLVVSNGIISLEHMQTVKANPGMSFAPQLNLRFAAGDNLWFQRGSAQRPTRIRIEPARITESGAPRGYLDIGGAMTSRGVTLAGEFESAEGQLAFPNGTLSLLSGVARLTRSPGGTPVVTVSAEAEGRVGDYLVSLSPSGQLYPAEASDGSRSVPGLALNLVSIPAMEEAYVMALLKGPIVAPALGARSDITSLLTEPTRGGAASGQIEGIRLPAFADSLGMQELSLDVALAGDVRLRLGQRLLKRLVVSYVSTLSGPVESRTLRFSYEVTPRYSLGYGVNELDQGRWEANAFIAF